MNEIAVVGMACRFPSGLDSIDALWRALVERVNTARDVPADRWEAERYISAEESARGMAYVKRGNFLNQDVRSFDAGFFDIPPRMAEVLDPQQRLMLEVVWEAFENAGIDLTARAGSDVGVYVGGFMLDHMITSMQPGNRVLNNQNTAAGMMMTMLSNRISHAFDLRGPSLSIDTACSSSLVAFNYACRDLWDGRCQMAVVGGVNVMTRPEYSIGMSKGHFLARDGECKSFDERGDGYGRAEGAGVVLLKPLKQALADGDTILATVAGTGVNSDGRTPGISMPSAEAQRQLIVDTCARFNINPRDVRYVECHGTGTAVGDPIEANSVGSVYGQGKEGDERLVIGTIKSNIGHMEAGAGVAGVIKAVLSLVHRTATPLGNLKTPHPGIPFDELGIQLPVSALPLSNPHGPLLAAVNSFGYGGTNAHAVLRAYEPPVQAALSAADAADAGLAAVRMLPLSTRSPAALAALAGSLAAQLGAGDDASHSLLNDVLYTSIARRAHLSHRAVVMGETKADLIEGLQALAAGTAHERVCTGVQPYAGRREPVLVFTGMGPQWWGMGRELYADNAIYKATVDEADAHFKRIAGFSILAEMLKPEAESAITRTHLAQPANFMVQIGVAAVLLDSGVKPAAVVGHSVGEVSSAYLSGALSLEDALTVSYHRSRLQATTAGTGGMLAVGLSMDAAQRWLEPYNGLIDLAAINGPTTLTLAGDSQALAALSERLTQAEVFNRALTVEVPYHSHLMEPILAELVQALASISPQVPTVPVVSTVSGHWVEGPGFGADYWPANVRRPVAFQQAIQTLLDAGYTTFVEVGPHPVLSSALRDIAKAAGKDLRLIETLRRAEGGETRRLQKATAMVHAVGCDLDWQRYCPQGRLISLPNYPWQRERLWLETDRAAVERQGSLRLPMLGMQELPASNAWRTDLINDAVAYLREHAVSGTALLPAAGYLEALLEMSQEINPAATAHALHQVDIVAPLPFSVERLVDMVTNFERATGVATIRSHESGKVGEGSLHVTARLGAPGEQPTLRVDPQALAARFGQAEDIERFYRGLQGLGLHYGKRFQTVRRLMVDRKGGEVLAQLSLDPTEAARHGSYLAHPSLLDGSFQTLFAMLDGTQAYLPTHIEELRLMGRLPQHVWCHGKLMTRSARQITCDIRLFDESGTVLALVRGLRVVASTAKLVRYDQYGDAVKRQILTFQWSVGERLAEPRRLGHWLVVDGEATELGDEVTQRIEAQGARVVARVGFGEALDLSDDRAHLRVGVASDAQALLEKVGQLDGVVFLHGVQATPESNDPIAEQAIKGMIGVTQALAGLPVETRPRVYAVTRSAFQTDEYDLPVMPGQTAINGFVRVAFNELQGMRFTSVDLPADVAEDELQGLCFELLCDAKEDEVALRKTARLFSELQETHVLSQARLDYRSISDDRPVKMRPAGDSADATGTVKLLQMLPAPLPSDFLELRIEAMALPVSALSDAKAESLQLDTVEVIAVISAVGDAVSDWSVGDRVCGFVPADIASHLRVRQTDCALVPLPEGVEYTHVMGNLEHGTLGELLIDTVRPEVGDRALVWGDKRGRKLAGALQRAGVEVTLVLPETAAAAGAEVSAASREGALDDAAAEASPGATADADVAQGLRTCPASSTALELVAAEEGGFDLLVAPLGSWAVRMGWVGLRSGATLVDTAEAAGAAPLHMPADGASVVNLQLSTAGRRPVRLRRAMRSALNLIASGSVASVEPLAMSVIDLAWKRLETPNSDLEIMLTFDHGKDAPVHLQDRMAFRPDAHYLVTGGFGGFGQRTAQWLAEHGARHLVLVGRTGADTPERQAFVEGLQAAGVSVMAAACDTSNAEQFAALLSRIAATGVPLRGIFHSAAVIKDQAIADIDMGTFEQVMRNKALAAWVMHEQTLDLPLDHFVMYSSVANSVGNSRQASYSAANGFIDGLAWARRSAGLAGTSVNWGAISDVGVVTRDEKLEQFLRYIGLRGIPSQEGLDLLGQALQRDVTQYGVTIITNWGDWARYETLGGKSPRYGALIAADSTGADSAVRERLRSELAALPPEERFEVLSQLVSAVIAGELQVAPETVALDRPINELGVDSLMATEIQLLLESQLAIQVSVLELLNDATVRFLTERTLKQLELETEALQETPLPG